MHFENTRGQRVDYKRQRTRTRSTTFKQKYPLRLNEHDNFLKPKDDRTYGERVDDRALEAGYWELKDLKDAVKMVEATATNLGAISPRKAKKCKSRLKEAYDEPAEMYGENTSSDPRNDNAPSAL